MLNVFELLNKNLPILSVDEENRAREEAEERAARESQSSAQDERDDSEDQLRPSEPEVRESPATVMSDEPPTIIEPEPEEEETPETKELGEVNVKSAEEESRVKKCIVSYQSKVLKSREPSPAPSHGKQLSRTLTLSSEASIR